MTRSQNKWRRVALAGATASVVAALSATQAARADLGITATKTGNESKSNGTYDIINFYLTGLTGVDAANQSGGSGTAGLLGLNGTFTTSANGVLAVAGDSDSTSAGYFGTYLQGGVPPSGYDTSYVNRTVITPTRSGTGTSTIDNSSDRPTATAISGVSRSFSGTFYNTTTITPGATSRIARILVTPGYSVSYSGTYTTYGSNNVSTGFAYNAPIVQLTAGTAAPYTNFTQLNSSNASFSPSSPQANSINVVGGSTISTAHVNASAGLNTGYVQATGFQSSTYQLYALKLSVNGVAIPASNASVGLIVSDINASASVDGITASSLADAGNASFNTSSTFQGYDILLKLSGTAATSTVLSWNFDNETNVTGVTVTDIAAAPEPTSLALLGVGVAGLVGRRRRREVIQ